MNSNLKVNENIFPLVEKKRNGLKSLPESLKAVAQTEAELQRFMCRKMTSRKFTGPSPETGSSSIRSNHAYGIHRGIEHYAFQANI